MGLLDTIMSKSADQAAMVQPEKGSATKPGYFDWKVHGMGPNKNEAIGCILPPYKEWLAERVQAVHAGVPFQTPFAVGHGKHAVGNTKKNKVYSDCQQALHDLNKTKNGFPLLPADIAALGRDCAVCNICWTEIWPMVEAHKHNEKSPEYKTYKEAHRQATPSQRYLFNWLPAGSAEPLVIDLAKTPSEQIMSIQYDSKQPDLLWPYSVSPQNLNSWVQIVKTEDEFKTEYKVLPVYMGVPQCFDANRAFNEAAYMQILDRMKDLRTEIRNFVPKPDDIQKALAKLASSVSIRLSIHTSVVAQTQAATAGLMPTPAPTGPTPVAPMPPPSMPTLPGAPMMPPAAVAPAPAAPQMPIQPQFAAPPAPTPLMPAPVAIMAAAPAPVVPAPAAPASVLSLVGQAPAAPMAPPTPVSPAGTPKATQTFEMLQGLLAPKP